MAGAARRVGQESTDAKKGNSDSLRKREGEKYYTGIVSDDVEPGELG